MATIPLTLYDPDRFTCVLDVLPPLTTRLVVAEDCKPPDVPVMVSV